ncbi:unnamed protein product [Brugia pahangi]|uniref:Uncharacterized protein n=1 Tax=Brugia pahangi TaxID=6280 RepID=A0A0N4TBA9_BRUPA|nr:unnamed protein product [Brugia pahangi]
MGIVEQTRLAPEFVTEIEKYYKYQEDVDKLVDRLEIVLQNDETVLRSGNIECSEKTDPYEIFAQNINAFRSFQPENAQVIRKIKSRKLDYKLFKFFFFFFIYFNAVYKC